MDTGVTMTEMEGAESQMASGRGSPDSGGFISIFDFFSYSVLTSDTFGSLQWHLLGQLVMLMGQE